MNDCCFNSIKGTIKTPAIRAVIIAVISFNSIKGTFYGIETEQSLISNTRNRVLIVPFMELKHLRRKSSMVARSCLNRTFYGIETGVNFIHKRKSKAS